MHVTGTLSNRLTAALLALALVVLGFGHQHAPAAPADPALRAYLAAGGSPDDLCLDRQDAPHDRAQDCPVCTLANAMALPLVTGQTAFLLRITFTNPPGARHLVAGHHTRRGPPTRGPPIALA